MLREPLLLATLRLVLFNYGIALHDVEGVQLRAGSLDVASLSLSLPGASERSTVEDLRVEFVPREALNGKLRVLNVARITLHSGTSAASGSRSTSMADIPSALANVLLFPVADTRIESLTIAPWLQSAQISLQHESLELTAAVKTADLQLDLRANWHDSKVVSGHIIPEKEVVVPVATPGTVTAALRMRYRDSPALSVDLSTLPSDDGITVDMSGDAGLEALAELARSAGVPPSVLNGVSGNIRVHAHGRIGGSPDMAHEFVLDVAPAQIQLPLLGELTVLQWEALSLSGQCTGSGTCALMQETALTASTQSAEGLQFVSASGAPSSRGTADNVRLRSTGKVTLDDDGLSVALNAGSEVALGRLSYNALTLRDTVLKIDDALTLTWDRAEHWRAEGSTLTLQVPHVQYNDQSAGAVFSFSNFGATGELSGAPVTSLQAELRGHGLVSSALPFTLRTPEVTATIALNEGRASAKGVLRIADRMILDAAIDYDLSRGEGTAALSIPTLPFDAGTGSLASLFTALPFTADIIAGSIGADAQLRLQEATGGGVSVAGPLHLTIGGVSGFVQETAILDMSVDVEAEVLAGYALRSTAPARVHIASVDPGIPVQNVGALVEFDTGNNALVLSGLEASIFSGTMRSEGGIFALDTPEGTLQLQLEKINLTDILALSAYEGVAASGLVSGMLPVSLREGALSIAGGALFAEAPGGNIRYAGSGAASGNAALDFVNQTLSNYQYDVMDAGVDYQANGDLALSVKLQGINPDTNPGQRINLNLNISDNIPTLLRSLQAGRSITDAVEQQLQRQ